ncbi:MAG: four helix bundle protein [Patescibacteria group bacterium]
MEKIQKFTDLVAWKEGHKLVLAIYKATGAFPREETFALTDQIRRAATSITSNIAEGFSKKTAKEKTQFYHTALGSLNELQSQLITAKDLGYTNPASFKIADELSVGVSKLINGLMKTAKTFGSNT